jgi:Integrase core domain
VAELRRRRQLGDRARPRSAATSPDKMPPTAERLRFDRELPQRMYCGNARKFVCGAMDLWAYTNGFILDFSRRSKPANNAAIESFNARFRDECLNVHWFGSLEDAAAKIEAWRRTMMSIILTVLSRLQPR